MKKLVILSALLIATSFLATNASFAKDCGCCKKAAVQVQCTCKKCDCTTHDCHCKCDGNCTCKGHNHKCNCKCDCCKKAN